MSLEENKALARKSFDEPWNQGNFSSLAELYDATLASHGLGVDVPPGVEGLKQFISIYRTAFPDVRFTIDDQIAEEDRVATRWTAVGTHQGSMMGIAPTGEQVTVTGMVIDRFADGKIVETWYNFDALGQLRQLGVVPTTEHSSTDHDASRQNAPEQDTPEQDESNPVGTNSDELVGYA